MSELFCFVIIAANIAVTGKEHGA